uniref:Uncharacterized protein n=1 Tax=Cacopsylla melanoneura TaxID=428564 RepID=A0A8D8WW20_9HEMI
MYGLSSGIKNGVETSVISSGKSMSSLQDSQHGLIGASSTHSHSGYLLSIPSSNSIHRHKDKLDHRGDNGTHESHHDEDMVTNEIQCELPSFPSPASSHSNNNIHTAGHKPSSSAMDVDTPRPDTPPSPLLTSPGGHGGKKMMPPSPSQHTISSSPHGSDKPDVMSPPGNSLQHPGSAQAMFQSPPPQAHISKIPSPSSSSTSSSSQHQLLQQQQQQYG